jgi:hypothetical protein
MGAFEDNNIHFSLAFKNNVFKDQNGEEGFKDGGGFIANGRIKKDGERYVAYQLVMKLYNLKNIGYHVEVFGEGETFQETLKDLQTKIDKINDALGQPATTLLPYTSAPFFGSWSANTQAREHLANEIASIFKLSR